MKSIYSFIMLFFLVNFSNCASRKLKAPFSITKAEKTVTENTTTINLTIENKQNVTFEKLYYNNEIITIKPNNASGITSITGVFTKKNKLYDLNLYGDATKEFGNTLSKKIIKFPFDYKTGQVFVSYEKDGKIIYHLVKNIQNR